MGFNFRGLWRALSWMGLVVLPGCVERIPSSARDSLAADAVRWQFIEFTDAQRSATVDWALSQDGRLQLARHPLQGEGETSVWSLDATGRPLESSATAPPARVEDLNWPASHASGWLWQWARAVRSGAEAPAGLRLHAVESLQLKDAKGLATELSLQHVTGLDHAPLALWLDAQGWPVARLEGDYALLRSDWVHARETLMRVQQSAQDRWLDDLARAHMRPAGRLLIHNARILDVRSGRLHAGGSVLIEDARIAAVDFSGRLPVSAAHGTLDAGGRVLMPGLWDNHSYHRGAHQSALNIALGITAVRDLGNAREETRRLDPMNLTTRIGPRLLRSIRFQGRSADSPFGDFLPAVGTAAELTALLDTGQGEVLLRNVWNLDPALLPAVGRAAAQRGLHWLGEPPDGATAVAFIEAGAREFLHIGSLLREWLPPRGERSVAERLEQYLQLSEDAPAVRAFAHLAAARGVSLEPTLSQTLNGLVGRAGDASPLGQNWDAALPPRARAELIVDRDRPAAGQAAFKRVQAVLLSLHRRGVRIVPAGYLPAALGLHHELALLHEAGIPAAEVLRLATISSAENLGLADQLGVIETGRLADLILLDDNPLNDLGNARKVHTVLANGRLIDARAVRRELGVLD